MNSLNLGILAHVDAGKTSLTERLLYTAGIIDEIGSVDAGNTQTDSLALEQQRGITIKSAVVSFVINNITINLIDTPGHPDFIAEVERVLSVLDGAILVISAVEGVQAQTRVLMRTLQRLHIPTLIFVNKIDRSGSRYESLLQDIADKLKLPIVPMGWPHNLGSRDASFTPFSTDDVAFTAKLADILSDNNEAILAAYVGDQTATPSYAKLHAELAAQTKQALVHPVFFGSAITGAGVESLIPAITELLPFAKGDADSPVSCSVFKIERGPAGEKIAYIRMFSGTIRARDRVRFGQDNEGKVTAISVFADGSTVERSSIVAGEIGKLWGLTDIQIGDTIGGSPKTEQHYFAPPTLETVVVPREVSDKGALKVALDQLAEQDPLINLRQDDVRQEIYVSLYGEVQKEVIQDTLSSDFGIEVEFRKTTTICIERPIGIGEAVEVKSEAPNPFLATVGLRVEPARIDRGIKFQLAPEVLGTMPLAFFKAVEDTVHETLKQGIYGWQVTDCTITLTHTGYAPRQSHAHARFDKSMSSTGADFRSLTPLVLMSALSHASTTVCEPIHHFNLEIPADTLSLVLPVLAQFRAVPLTTETRGSKCVLGGDIPASHVHELQQRLPALTSGEGILEYAFDRYEAARGEMPTRPRTDLNPLDRKEYLLRVRRHG